MRLTLTKRATMCSSADDAVIILEVGREKLCYLVGSAEIITCNGLEQLDISDLAQHHAAIMLGNHNWETSLDY